MNRFLVLAPAAALALFAFVAPVSAQESDPVTELKSLSRDLTDFHVHGYQRVERSLAHCEVPDQAELMDLAEQANDLSRRAGGLAPRLGGKQHATALTLQRTAETDFVGLLYARTPDVCYQPPAE